MRVVVQLQLPLVDDGTAARRALHLHRRHPTGTAQFACSRTDADDTHHRRDTNGQEERTDLTRSACALSARVASRVVGLALLLLVVVLQRRRTVAASQIRRTQLARAPTDIHETTSSACTRLARVCACRCVWLGPARLLAV